MRASRLKASGHGQPGASSPGSALLTCGDPLDQRIDRRLHGACRVVAALVGDDEIAPSALATTMKPGSAAITAPKPYSDAVFMAASTAPLIAARVPSVKWSTTGRQASASTDRMPTSSAPGEVVVRAPWLTQGYLHNPDASAELWAGGYLHTGDIGTIDAGGYLRVADRIKDVIKTGGEWISSLALEDTIALHPAVNEVAVIGITDTKWGERPLPLVVRHAGSEVSEAEIIERVAARSRSGDISRFAIPDRVHFVDAIERTSVGKINKKKLRGLHDPGAAADAR